MSQEVESTLRANYDIHDAHVCFLSPLSICSTTFQFILSLIKTQKPDNNPTNCLMLVEHSLELSVCCVVLRVCIL
jgi:hypothetical protein